MGTAKVMLVMSGSTLCMGNEAWLNSKKRLSWNTACWFNVVASYTGNEGKLDT